MPFRASASQLVGVALILVGCDADPPERLIELAQDPVELALPVADASVPWSEPTPPVFVEAEPAPEPNPSPRYEVKIAKPVIAGDLDRHVLDRYVKRRRAMLARCARWGTGVVEVEYMVNDRGKLLIAHASSTTASDAATRCLVRTISNWIELPRVICAPARVTQRFELAEVAGHGNQ